MIELVQNDLRHLPFRITDIAILHFRGYTVGGNAARGITRLADNMIIKLAVVLGHKFDVRLPHDNVFEFIIQSDPHEFRHALNRAR